MRKGRREGADGMAVMVGIKRALRGEPEKIVLVRLDAVGPGATALRPCTKRKTPHVAGLFTVTQ